MDPKSIKGFELLDRLVAKALEDDEYRRRLIDDPKAVLREEGLTVPDEVTVEIHQNTKDRLHLVLPSDSEREKLEIEEIDVRIIDRFWPY